MLPLAFDSSIQLVFIIFNCVCISVCVLELTNAGAPKVHECDNLLVLVESCLVWVLGSIQLWVS